MVPGSNARILLPCVAFSLGALFPACGLDEGGVTPGVTPDVDSGIFGDTGPRPDVAPRPDVGPDARIVGGTVSGLQGRGLTLQNNGADDVVVERDGTFTFPTPLASGAKYDVRIKPGGLPTSPHQTCTVTASSGTVGQTNVETVKVSCTFFRTCKELKDAFPTAVSATYALRPAEEKATARCDMDHEGGGWTLIEATSDDRGPDDLTEAGPDSAIEAGKNRFMKSTSMKAVAVLSKQVHIRQNANANDSITSVATDSRLLDNLRAGNSLNTGYQNLQKAEQIALWSGPRAAEGVHFSGSVDKLYPSIYWARNNTKGLHFFGVLSTYEWDGDLNRENNKPMEVYLR